jgi:hypothetical protein
MHLTTSDSDKDCLKEKARKPRCEDYSVCHYGSRDFRDIKESSQVKGPAEPGQDDQQQPA